MRVSREGDYGLRAITYLSSRLDKTIPTSEISREQGIPIKFLARIMPKLVRHKIVTSIPGSKGGYRLARPPKQVSFLEVLEAVEGPIAINRCLEESCDCERTEVCSMKNIWRTAQTKMKEYFGEVHFDQIKE
ncbi:MAG: Rrf2 family transcriptional regulator [bacterium]|nr:Rrf2 family transcriptional regulator [bacterium]